MQKNRLALNNYHLPHKWLEHIEKNNHAIQQQHILNNDEILNEIILMGLRSKYGVTKEILTKYLAKDHLEIFSTKLAELQANQLINYNQDGFQATYKGFKLLNSISNYLL